MSGATIMAQLLCGNGHHTQTEVINPVLDAGGAVTGGYAGSDRDFCQVCDSPDMTITGYTEVGEEPDDPGDPCDDGCHLPGEHPVIVEPQPDAADYGEPTGPVPCCSCWQLAAVKAKDLQHGDVLPSGKVIDGVIRLARGGVEVALAGGGTVILPGRPLRQVLRRSE